MSEKFTCFPAMQKQIHDSCIDTCLRDSKCKIFFISKQIGSLYFPTVKRKAKHKK